MSNAERNNVLVGFQKIGLMKVISRYADSGRFYLPEDKFAVGLYIGTADNHLNSVRDIDDFRGTMIESVCNRFSKYRPVPGELPLVGCLLVDGRWRAKSQLENRSVVQLQAFPEGLLAVPRTGSVILTDPTDSAELLAIAMTVAANVITSELHWKLPGATTTVLDTWKWPD